MKAFWITGIFLVLHSFLWELSAQQSRHLGACGFADHHLGLEICEVLQHNMFTSNAAAERAIDRILEPIGLPRNFVILSCSGIQNAVALTGPDGLRYIIYDQEFMASMDKAAPNWAALSILAHEVGHHLCGHTLRMSDNLVHQRSQELEADEFSGFVMAKLGATLAQAQAAISTVARDGDDTYSTHPALNKRLAAIEKGYQRGARNAQLTHVHTGPSAEQYFNDAYHHSLKGNYRGALDAYTRAIEMNRHFFLAFYNRGLIYYELKDYNRAEADFKEVIRLQPAYSNGYLALGTAHQQKGSYMLAKNYYDQAIEKDPGNYVALLNRGGILDYLNDYSSAIKDYDRCIELAPNDPRGWKSRGESKKKAGLLVSAQFDLEQAKRLESGSTTGISNQQMAEAFWISGQMKMQQGDHTGACADFRRACQYGHTRACIAVTMQACP